MPQKQEKVPEHQSFVQPEFIGKLGKLGIAPEHDDEDVRDAFGYEYYPLTSPENDIVGFLLVVEVGGSIEPVVLEKNKTITFKASSGLGKLWVAYPDKEQLELHSSVNEDTGPIKVTQHSVTGIKNLGDTPLQLAALFDPAFQRGDEVALSEKPQAEVPSSFFLHYSDDDRINQHLSGVPSLKQ